MERCILTQVPCRKAIMEIINANKCRSSLQNTHYLAKLFQLADAGWEVFKQLPEIDQKRFWLILRILHTDDLEDIKMTQSFANALFRARLKKEMEEKSKKKNSKRAADRTKKQQLTA